MPWRMLFWNDELHVSPKGMVCDMVQSTSTILTIALKAIPPLATGLGRVCQVERGRRPQVICRWKKIHSSLITTLKQKTRRTSNTGSMDDLILESWKYFFFLALSCSKSRALKTSQPGSQPRKPLGVREEGYRGSDGFSNGLPGKHLERLSQLG